MKQKNKILICCIAFVINLLLFFTKIYIALSSNSISIYVDSLNSLADSFVCFIAIVVFKAASVKANENYPFGLGKIETLINFILSLVILFTGCAFIYSSLQRLMYPVPVWYSLKYAVIIAVTAAVKLVMALAYRKIYKATASSVMKSLATDSILDFFVSACIVVSFTLTSVLGYAVDSVMGIAASLFIIVSGIKTFIASCSEIIGKKDKELTSKASDILNSDSRVTAVLRSEAHIYGDYAVINAEIKADVQDANEVFLLNDSLKSEIKQKLNAELFVTFGGN